MNTVHINAGGIAFLCACRHFEGGFMKDAINLIEVPNHDRGTVKRQKVTAFSRTPAGATEGYAWLDKRISEYFPTISISNEIMEEFNLCYEDYESALECLAREKDLQFD
jgi:hypothetical protein